MADLRLNAADRHHHGAGRVRIVCPLDEAFDDVVASGDLPAGADADPISQACSDQRVVDCEEAVGERSAHVILVLQGSGARAALGTVDDDEVGCGPDLEHRLADREHIRAGSHAEFESRGLAAGEFAHPCDELDEFDRGAEDAEGGRAHALLSLWDASGAGDLGVDLRRGQHASDSGLRALAQFE